MNAAAPLTLAARIDHTLLRPEATPADALRLADEALEHGFAAACVNGRLLEPLRQRLERAARPGAPRPAACAVAGFPLGAVTPTALAMEATLLAKAGADEIDAVAWLPRLLAVRSTPDIEPAAIALRDDILPMVRAVRAANAGVVMKLILETAALRAACDADAPGDAEGARARFERMIRAGCRAARESGCDFVKTSAGFHPAGGATVEAVSLLRRHAGPLRVKASGAVRTRDDALRLIDAGADRIGASAGVAILRA